MEEISQVSLQNVSAVEQMTKATRMLAGESDKLRQRVEAFKI